MDVGQHDHKSGLHVLTAVSLSICLAVSPLMCAYSAEPLFREWVPKFEKEAKQTDETCPKNPTIKLTPIAPEHESAIARPTPAMQELSEKELAELFEKLPDLRAEKPEAVAPIKAIAAPFVRKKKHVEVSMEQPLQVSRSTAARLESKVTASDVKILSFGPTDLVKGTSAVPLTIVFSEDMTDVISAIDVNLEPIVKLSPQPPGTWRWVNQRTLSFEPAQTWPHSTRFEVNVPAKLKSLSGVELKTQKSWTFGLSPV